MERAMTQQQRRKAADLEGRGWGVGEWRQAGELGDVCTGVLPVKHHLLLSGAGV